MNLDELHARLVSLGREWAELKAAADWLSESRKSVRAQIVLKHLPEAKSVSKAEIMAEADTDYIAHLKAMTEAEKKANLANVNYKAAQVWCDMERSKMATARAEMTLR